MNIKKLNEELDNIVPKPIEFKDYVEWIEEDSKDTINAIESMVAKFKWKAENWNPERQKNYVNRIQEILQDMTDRCNSIKKRMD